MQSTGHGSDSELSSTTSSSDGEYDVSARSDSKKEEQGTNHEKKAVCSGDGGCGETFPIDTPGADFEYAMLCSTCYKKQVSSSNDNMMIGGKEEDGNKEDCPEQQDSSSGNGGDDPPGDNNSSITEQVDSTSATTTKNNGWKMAEDESGDESSVDEALNENNDAGKAIGLVLNNVRDIDPENGRYDVEAGGNTHVYLAYINDQDNITRKCKKFWNIQPNSSYVLYGYLNYQALLNTSSRRGWLGHCRLKSASSSNGTPVGDGYVLWEIWETRCPDPRIDGILIKENGDVILLKHLQTWLVKHKLSSDVNVEFDEDFYKK